MAAYEKVPTDLCYALQQGQLCCVAGLSPYRQHAMCSEACSEMEKRGYRSIVLQLSPLSKRLSVGVEWDKYVIKHLWHSFHPTNGVRLAQWLKATEALSPQERLMAFTNDLFLSDLCESPMAIFIDDMDAIANIPFAVSDLFAWIEYCYELRDTYLSYHHLSFAVFSGHKRPSLDAATGFPRLGLQDVKCFYPSCFYPSYRPHLCRLALSTVMPSIQTVSIA